MLMPMADFRTEVTRRPASWPSVRDLADRFVVTPSAVVQRLLLLHDCPWHGLILHWEPLDDIRPFDGFKVVNRVPLGRSSSQMFARGYQAVTRGLFMAYHKGMLNTDFDAGHRLDSVGLNCRGRRQVFSFVTKIEIN
jgi:hypothetical protein